jgi:hypothetical protein
MAAFSAASTRAEVWRTAGVQNVVAGMLFSRAALSMPGTGGRVRAGIKNETRGLWGELCARVFGPCATEQWACGGRESMESVVPESMN